MKKGFKNFLIVCAVLVAVGIVLTGIGYALGGVADVSLGKWNFISLDVHNEKIDTYIVKEDKIFESFPEIQVETDLYDIEFLPSTEYKVEYSYIEDVMKPKISLEDGTLYIKAKNNDEKINKSFFSFLNKNNQDLTLKVYYPAGVALSTVKIDNAVGDVSINDFECDMLIADLDLGDINLKNADVGITKVDLALGDFSAENFESGFLRAKVNKGDIEVNGKLEGTTDIECDMGDVDLETSLSQKEYNYSLNVNLGNVTVNGTTIEFGSVSNYVEAENDITVNCELGAIDIDFDR